MEIKWEKREKFRIIYMGKLYIGHDMYPDEKFCNYLTIIIERPVLIQENSGDTLLAITLRLEHSR